MRGEGEIRIGVEVDGSLTAGNEGGAIGFADGTADEHFGGVEDAEDGLTAVELIAFLGVAQGIVTPKTLVGDHTGERGVELESGHIRLGAFETDLLTIALELEDAEGSSIALVVGGVGPGEAIDVGAGVVLADVGFEAVDFTENGALLELDGGLGEIGLGLAEVRGTLFGVGAILGALLFDLMAEIVELGLGVASKIDLLSAIEDSHEVAQADFGPVGDEFGEGHGAALTPDLGNEDFGGVDGFDGAGDADLAFDARGIGSGGVGDWRRGLGTGGEEEQGNRDRQRRRHEVVSGIRRQEWGKCLAGFRIYFA
jgi:hypothetical protein